MHPDGGRTYSVSDRRHVGRQRWRATMRVQVCMHVPYEFVGSMEPWFAARQAAVRVCRLYAGERPAGPAAFDWLVLMGGPMSVNDERELPWLVAEKELVRAAIAADKTVLGICLGAQLIASALGAAVYRNAVPEVGWFDVAPVAGPAHPLRAPFATGGAAYHWHGETFDLPAGAVHLARSAACEHQMFAVGERVVALQFHLEVTRDGIAEMIRHAGPDLAPGAFVQASEEMVDDRVDFNTPHRLLASLLDRWCDGGGL